MNTLNRSPSQALLLATVVALAACTADQASSDSRAEAESDSAPSQQDPISELLQSLPLHARMLVGSGGVRTSAYWVVWSSCGEGSRAETAAANGGREAGWLIVDDLLDDPGISLGEWPVTTCPDALGVLEGDTADPVARVAQQLLTAELNLTAGAGTCAVTRELVIAGHALLARQQYAGSPVDPETLDEATAASVGRLADLLSLYNAGRLCR